MSTPPWSELLASACEGRAQPLDGHSTGIVSALLDDAWRTARATWPDVALSAEAFVAHVARHLPAEAAVAQHLEDVSTADLYLACACAKGDAAAFAAFEQHCMADLQRALARLRLDADVVTEVKQRIRCRLLVPDGGPPRIVEFRGSGTLRGWVRVMAVREALRMLRRRHGTAGADEADRLHDFVSPARIGLDGAKERYGRAFSEAFDRAVRQLSARDQAMLRQHVLDGMTIDQLGALYRIHRATAARILDRARRTLLAATRARMRAGLEVSSTELDSILRLIRSRMEISLRGLRRRRGA